MSNDQNICTWMINQRQNTVISINILSLQLTEGERIFIQDIGYQNNITIYNNALTNITTWTSKTNHVQIEYHKSATRNGQFQLYYRTANDFYCSQTFSTYEGQRLTHAISSRQCRLDGTWSHLLNPTCTPVSCIAPPIAFAGFPKKYIHFVKSNLEFECIDGYEKSHNETVYCNYDGNWMTQSEEMVKCVLKKNSIMDNCSCGGQKEINKCCSKKLCKNGGMGYTLKNGLIYCLCPVGFVGTRCEHGINICEMVGGSENYCNNQGECYVEGGKAMCKCNKLFHGDYCEHHRDFCVERNVTCFDKGVCATIHGTSETICKCQPNRFGKYCEKVMDYCKFDPCINNGSCIQDLNEGYVCLCQKDYSGRICQVNNSPCSNSPCSNGGKCIVQNDNEFACICSLRYTGKYCTEFVDLCKTANVDGNYCLNNATCHSIRGDQVVCECLDGFSGKQCQDEDVSVRDSYNLYFTPSKSYDMPSQISFNSTISVSANRTQKPLIISPAIRSSFLNETTICGWIKPDSTTKPNATFAVIGSYNGYEMVDSLLSFTDSQIIVNLKPPVILNYKLNTNRWQHFCLRSPRTRKRNFTSWDYFYNGDLLESSKDNVLPLYIDQRHIRLSLGQSLNFKTKFEGELTMIEMYSEVLSNNLIHDLATKCSANITRPPIIGWKDYSNTEGISGNVVKIEPGLCSNTSPVDRTGHILRDPSDTLPLTQNTNYNTKVINCPKNIINETDKDGLVIDWEPKNEKQIFENGPKIKNIFVNFASGSYFPIGSYQIIYIATNQYNVKSICQFSVVVKKKESSDRFHHYLFI
uniref:Delta-like protein n=1 Tax=Rhabditophanes sp. KR3021 TaxID=114890 RepID=A0AC35U7M1_9BILA